MNRTLAACLVLAALSGCVAQPDPATPTHTQQPAPEPVRIMERIDLHAGLPETSWSLEVAPGQGGHIHAHLEGPAGAPQFASPGFCYRFEGEQDDGSTYGTQGGGNCGSPSVSYSSGSSRGLVHLDGDAFGSGRYRFTFSAEPSAAVLVLEMVAEAS